MYEKEELIKKQEMLYEGKAKKLFKTFEDDKVIIHFKDSATAFNNQKKATLETKGIINNKISNLLLNYLEGQGIKTHYIKTLNEREILAKHVKLIPLEVVARNVVAGSLAKRTGLSEGFLVEPAIVEFYYKDDELGDPLITEEHMRLLKICSIKTKESLKEKGLKINSYLSQLFSNIGLMLVDIKFEFGYYEDEIILCDELSPDSCRLWDKETKTIFDKDRFRKDMDDVLGGYREVLNRLTKALG